MLNLLNGAGERIERKGLFDLRRYARPFCSVAKSIDDRGGTRPFCKNVGELASEIGAVVAIDRNMGDVLQLQFRFGKAVGQRLRGKTGPVLDATEALLLRGRDQLAVLHEAGRRVGVIGIETDNIHEVRELC